jgi:hypothetical protein
MIEVLAGRTPAGCGIRKMVTVLMRWMMSLRVSAMGIVVLLQCCRHCLVQGRCPATAGAAY